MSRHKPAVPPTRRRYPSDVERAVGEVYRVAMVAYTDLHPDGDAAAFAQRMLDVQAEELAEREVQR